MSGFRTEKQLWAFMKPLLNGKWWRVETIIPEGFPDALGIYNGDVRFLELKIGKPRIEALRPSQRLWMSEVLSGTPHVWTAFGSKDNKEVYFVQGLHGFNKSKTDEPSFWAGPTTILSLRPAPAAAPVGS